MLERCELSDSAVICIEITGLVDVHKPVVAAGRCNMYMLQVCDISSGTTCCLYRLYNTSRLRSFVFGSSYYCCTEKCIYITSCTPGSADLVVMMWSMWRLRGHCSCCGRCCPRDRAAVQYARVQERVKCVWANLGRAIPVVAGLVHRRHCP